MAMTFEDTETDIGKCLRIQVVLSVSLNFSSGIQRDSKWKKPGLLKSF